MEFYCQLIIFVSNKATRFLRKYHIIFQLNCTAKTIFSSIAQSGEKDGI
ncbi:hypothetical protein HMPREF3203_02389 [Proteus mirabilis]|nr:hypothetical protein HMPREF3203_02389 [Proteus mirabilis]